VCWLQTVSPIFTSLRASEGTGLAMRSHDATRQSTRRGRAWAWEGDEGEQQHYAVCVCSGHYSVIQRVELRLAGKWPESDQL